MLMNPDPNRIHIRQLRPSVYIQVILQIFQYIFMLLSEISFAELSHFLVDEGYGRIHFESLIRYLGTCQV